MAINNKTHKLRATFEWVKHLPYMRFAECPDQIENLARELLENGSGKYDSMTLKPYYDKLSEKIN